MVFLILCSRWCLNVRERRAPESQTPPIFPRFPPSLASLASLSLLLLFSAPLPLPLPAARCPLWWLIGVASRHFVSHFIVRWCFRILKESDHAMSELCGVSISQVPPVCVNSVTNWLPSMFILSRAKLQPLGFSCDGLSCIHAVTMSLPIRRTRACACAGFRVSPAHRAVAASIAFRNRAMFLAFRSCRAIANDDTFGWLRVRLCLCAECL